MGIKCGIVGLPNVGKSTLFNALTESGIQAENYPFCTIDPNVGMVEIPDARQDKISAIVSPKKEVPAVMEFVDIAGLVAGASKGEGLGNKFLANIRETDAIAHVVRCFEDDNIQHVSDKIDPGSDIEVINTELALADLESVSKALEKAKKNSKGGDKEQIAIARVMEKVQAQLDEGNLVRALDLNEDEQVLIRPLFLLTNKPTMYIANVAEDGFENNPMLDIVKDIAAKEGAVVVAISAAIESELVEMEAADKKEFLRKWAWQSPA